MTAKIHLAGQNGGRDVAVTADPATGRIQVNPFAWDVEAGGRYLHVGFGIGSGQGCDVTRWVVADNEDLSATTAYDAEGAALPVQHFPLAPEWASSLARIRMPPFAPVDCVYAASHPQAAPTDPGGTIWSADAVAMTPVSFGTGTDIFPATIHCPSEVPAGGQLVVSVGYTTAPGSYAPAGIAPRPSQFGSIEFTVDPGSGLTVASSPEPPTDVDLWTDDSWNGDLVLDLAPSDLFVVKADGNVTIDGTTGHWTCGGRIPVTVPVPTDWEGTLAGQTWWKRGNASSSGIGDYFTHRAYEFLDDEWVYVTGEYVEPRTEPCTTVSGDVEGCHRYYYDADSNRLQIDDRLAKKRHGGWGMPSYSGRYDDYSVDHVVRTVADGRRLAYTGEGNDWGSLTLRRNGTYTCRAWCAGDHESWSGRYRFIGGELVLHKKGPDFRSAVALFSAVHDGRTRLLDIDTADRLLRVRRW